MLSRKQKPNLWLIFTILDACFLYDVFVFLDLRNANINSRFVSKGPINKLLNNIAMSFGSASDIEKQNRSQIYPLFLEPSKTFVEFKDMLRMFKRFSTTLKAPLSQLKKKFNY